MKRHRPLNRLLPIAAAVGMAFAPSVYAQTWSNPLSGSWHVGSNWVGNTVPGAGATVDINVTGPVTVTYNTGTLSIGSLTVTAPNVFAITAGALTISGAYSNAGTTSVSSSGTLSLNGVSSLASLEQSGGVLSGTGAVSVGTATFTGGTMSGAGTTNFAGSVGFTGDGSRTISGGRVVNLNGGATWSGNTSAFGNRIFLGGTGGATINNNGTFLDQNAFSTDIPNFGSGVFNNLGQYTKSGAGTTSIEVLFNNTFSAAGTGVVNINAGTLSLNGGGTANAGSVFQGSGTLRFGSSYTLSPTTTIAPSNVFFSSGTVTVSGPYTVSGTTTVEGGVANFTGASVALGTTLAVSGGTVNLNTAAAVSVPTLVLTGGAVGGTATLNVTNPSTWAGGTMTNAGTTNFAGAVGFTGDGSRTISGGRVVNLNGSATWSGNTSGFGNRIFLGGTDGATINNNGTFLDQNAFSTDIPNFGSGVFNNLGQYTKSGAGTTSIEVLFNNTFSAAGTGVVNINAGTLSLTGGGTANAQSSFNIGTGAMLFFNGGTYNLNSVAFGPGTGTMRVNSLVNATGTHSFGGSLVIASSGVLDVANTFTASGGYTQEGGTVRGTGTLNVSGAASWTGGTMSGAGTTNFASAVSFTGDGNRTISGGRVVNLNGGATWSGNTSAFGNRIFLGGTGGATINNNGTFLDQNAFSTDIPNFGSGVFNNLGQYTKSGAGTTSIEVGLSNTGVVNVTAGTLALSGIVTNLATNTLTGGVWQVRGSGVLDFTQANTAIATNAADIYLVGPSSVFRMRNASSLQQTLEQTLVTNNGALRLQQGRSFSPTANSGNFTNNGLLELTDSSFSAVTLTNTGSATVASFGTSTLTTTGTFVNSGTVLVNSGTLTSSRIAGGSGTVQVNPGATLDLSGNAAASSADFLIQNGALALGAQNFNVLVDYTNANWGSGNGFAPRANVTGTGQITGNNAAQSITGNVTAAGANTWTLALGNVRGGTDRTAVFRIANTGSGAQIRGAVQTGAPGLGNITDARLSGAGVSAANFGPIAAGANSGDLAVTLTAGATGGALAGQSVAVVSNFGNVATQTVNITGVTSVLAQGLATHASGVTPVNLGNFRVGTATPPSTTFSVQNLTSGPGAERLGIASTVTTGNFAATSTLPLLGGGLTQAGAITASINNGSAGVNNGSLDVRYSTNGEQIDPSFTTQNANLQTIALQASGYLQAQPALPATVNAGNFRITTGAAAQSFTLGNTQVAPAGFQETLQVSAAGSTLTGGATLTGGPAASVAPGASTSAFAIGFAPGGATGTRNGSATLALTSDGTAFGIGTLTLPTATINVTGTGFQIAQPALPAGPINLGNFRVGATPTASPAIGNTLIATQAIHQEALLVTPTSLSGTITLGGSGVSLGNALNPIAAGTSGSQMVLGLAALSAGANTGTVNFNLESSGAGTSGLANNVNLGTGSITVTGTGYVPAAYLVNNPGVLTLNFGTVLTGTPIQTGFLSITNSATGTAGFVENLNARFGGAAGTGANLLTGQGSVADLRPGQTDAGTLRVVVDTTNAGTVNASIPVNFFTSGRVFDGTSNVQIAGLAELGIGSETFALTGAIQATGQIANPASPRIDGSLPVVLGNLRVNSATSPAATLGLTNVATSAPQADLNASVAGTALVSAIGGVNRLAPGASAPSALSFSLTTAGRASAGAVNESAIVTFQSDLTTLGGCAPNCQIAAGTQTVQVQANIFRLGTGELTGAPLNLGAFRLAGVPALTGALGARNSAAADGFSEQAGIQSVSASAGFTAANTLGATRLDAGAAATPNAVTVGLAPALAGLAAGVNTGSVTVNFLSDGTASGTGSPVTSNSQSVGVQATGFRLANPVFDGAAVTLAARVGQAAPSVTRSIHNSSPDTYTEALGVTLSGATPGFNVTAPASLPIGAGQSRNLGIALDTSQARDNTGSPANLVVGFFSSGAGTTGAADQPLGSSSLSLTGRVYTPATGSATTVDFGVRRVGDGGGSVSASSTVTNTTAITALNDTLAATTGTVTGSAFAAGSPAGLAGLGAQQSGQLGFTMSTASAGVFNGPNAGSAVINYASRNPDLADLTSSESITLIGQVNNLARAAFRFLSGAGSFSEQNQTTFRLDFGDIAQGASGLYTARLAAWNRATGTADRLRGQSAQVAGGSAAFGVSGLGAFGDLGAGENGADIVVSLIDTGSVGFFTTELLLTDLFSVYPGLVDLGLGEARLQISANVVDGTTVIPLPPAAWLLLTGLAAFGWLGRRSKSAMVA